MNLEFDIDFESEVIHLLINNSIKIIAVKEKENTVSYRGLDKLSSIELQDSIKSVISTLFKIEEE